jgi:DNA-binding transcriptional MerR regulator
MLDKAGLPVTTVDDWARRGILPSRKIGRRRIYIRQDIEVLLIAPSSSGD